MASNTASFQDSSRPIMTPTANLNHDIYPNLSTVLAGEANLLSHGLSEVSGLSPEATLHRENQLRRMAEAIWEQHGVSTIPVGLAKDLQPIVSLPGQLPPPPVTAQPPDLMHTIKIAIVMQQINETEIVLQQAKRNAAVYQRDAVAHGLFLDPAEDIAPSQSTDSPSSPSAVALSLSPTSADVEKMSRLVHRATISSQHERPANLDAILAAYSGRPEFQLSILENIQTDIQWGVSQLNGLVYRNDGDICVVNIEKRRGLNEIMLKDLLASGPKLSRKGSAKSRLRGLVQVHRLRKDRDKDGGSKGGGSVRSTGGDSAASLLKKYGVCAKVAIGKGAMSVVRLAHKNSANAAKPKEKKRQGGEVMRGHGGRRATRALGLGWDGMGLGRNGMGWGWGWVNPGVGVGARIVAYRFRLVELEFEPYSNGV
ncbi:hypothetical protein K438DRAFT_1764505 [Mycena galopus ATCC 62051]|nr:hypothetical protein K438DRAFT_1764505 [Mycena galopus ATCC 62051]